MAHTISESSTFTASISIPDDGDTIRSADIENYIQGLANRTQYLKDHVDAAESDIGAIEAQIVNIEAQIVNEEWVYTTPKTRTIVIPGIHCTPGSGWTPSAGIVNMRATSNSAGLTVPLDFLPDGATLTRVRALVTPGVARATEGNRIQFDLVKRTLDFNAPSSGVATMPIFNGNDDGTDALQAIDSGVIAESIDKASGKTIAAHIQAGNTASTNNDTFWGLEITFEDPGPRNF